MRTVRGLVLVALLGMPGLLVAQGVDVGARLRARGVPPGLTREIAGIAAGAAAQGVPAGPLADKAIEGWAKQVPAPRIVAAVRQFAAQMAVAVRAIRSAGLESPPGPLVAAAAEAMRGGIGADEIQSVVRAAPEAEVAAPGLNVAAALAAQGIGSKQAVAIVMDAMRGRRAMSQLLDLPSVARAMQDEGMSPGEVGRRILEGGEGHPGGGRGGNHGERPPNVPPGAGRGHQGGHPPHPGG